MSKLSRRQTLLFTLGLAAATGLKACAPSQTSQTSESATESATESETNTELIPIRFGINPWPGAMPFMVADQQGFFRENGLDMKLTLFPSISNMMDAFNSGNVDVTLIDPGTLLVSAANGVDQRFVTVTDFSSGADAIVVAPSVESLEDFAGKDISVEFGSIGHFLLLKALEAGGLSKDDVNLVNQTADAALAAFTAGRTEIAVSYEPFISQAIEQGKGRVIYSTKDAPIAPDVVSARQDFLEQYPDAIARLIRTWYQTLDYRSQNLEEALAVEAEALGVTVEELKAFSDGVRIVDDPNEIASYFQLGQGKNTLEQTVKEVTEFLIAQGLLEEQPPAPDALIDNRFIEEYVAEQSG